MLAYVLFRTQRYDERIWPSAGEDQTDRPASLVHRDLSKSLVAQPICGKLESATTSSDQSEQTPDVWWNRQHARSDEAEASLQEESTVGG
jgi:hypothetical protein